MITLAWDRAGSGGEYWAVLARFVGGPDQLPEVPDLISEVEMSRSLNKAAAYALESLAKQLKELP